MAEDSGLVGCDTVSLSKWFTGLHRNTPLKCHALITQQHSFAGSLYECSIINSSLVLAVLVRKRKTLSAVHLMNLIEMVYDTSVSKSHMS